MSPKIVLETVISPIRDSRWNSPRGVSSNVETVSPILEMLSPIGEILSLIGDLLRGEFHLLSTTITYYLSNRSYLVCSIPTLSESVSPIGNWLSPEWETPSLHFDGNLEENST